MIWHPKPDQCVTLCYRKTMRPYFPHQATGQVIKAVKGPGPINALVRLDNNTLLVVPRGNLFLE